MSYWEVGLPDSLLVACFTAYTIAYSVHLLPHFPLLLSVKILQDLVKDLPFLQLFPFKPILYTHNFGLVGRRLRDRSYQVHWRSNVLKQWNLFLKSEILCGSPIYTTNQSIAALNRMKVGDLGLHLFLSSAFYLPPVPRAPPKKLKGATKHLQKPPFQCSS